MFKNVPGSAGCSFESYPSGCCAGSSGCPTAPSAAGGCSPEPELQAANPVAPRELYAIYIDPKVLMLCCCCNPIYGRSTYIDNVYIYIYDLFVHLAIY